MSEKKLHKQSLAEEAVLVIEEARMVLPGLQALSGFQLVAVFNQRFDTALTPEEQAMHLVAFLLVALSIVLVMTPAAYHRQARRGVITAGFISLASGLITLSMMPLAVGFCLDTYLIAHVITRKPGLSVALAGALFAVFVVLWFVFPALRRHRGRPWTVSASEHAGKAPS